MKLRSFKDKVLVILSVFSVLMIVAICVSVGIYYRRVKLREYGNYAFDYARAAADFIDGDTVLRYAETLETDEYYDHILDYLNATQKSSDVLYYYVFIPCEDDLIYVWDANTTEGACPLGFHEDYRGNGKELSAKAMSGLPDNSLDFTYGEDYGSIASAYYPIYNSDGESVALVGVDFSMPDIESNLLKFLITIVTISVLAVLILIFITYLIFNRSFVKPINLLNASTKGIVSHLETQDELRINIKTGDEIEELSDSFEQMYREVKEYIRKLGEITAEKERIGAELNVAKQIQASMLPCIFPPFPDRTEFDIFATMTPAKEVGGDFYDFFLIDDDHLAMVIADVSGKGVPAALFMVITKTLIKNIAQLGNYGVSEILERANDLLCENNEANMFVTVWLGILEISTGKLTAANAGHEFPVLKRRDGDFELFKDKHGFVLAGMEGVKYRSYEITLEKGDAIFLYTDGVAEATDCANELFGTERLLEILNRSKELAITDLLPTVKEGIDEFAGDMEQFDDITMLMLKLR